MSSWKFAKAEKERRRLGPGVARHVPRCLYNGRCISRASSVREHYPYLLSALSKPCGDLSSFVRACLWWWWWCRASMDRPMALTKYADGNMHPGLVQHQHPVSDTGTLQIHDDGGNLAWLCMFHCPCSRAMGGSFRRWRSRTMHADNGPSPPRVYFDAALRCCVGAPPLPCLVDRRRR